ncbi:MAG: hypothetical protein RR641_08525 [Erysipelotrichaceae bacterium]
MITELVTEVELEKWKELFNLYASSMLPNRKTGKELDDYFQSKYDYQIVDSNSFKSVIKANVMENERFRGKGLKGTVPIIKTYSVGNVMIGIDIISGYFQVESEEIDKAISIYDDLFIYLGLDATDLKNFVLVGQYLELTQQ